MYVQREKRKEAFLSAFASFQPNYLAVCLESLSASHDRLTFSPRAGDGDSEKPSEKPPEEEFADAEEEEDEDSSLSISLPSGAEPEPEETRKEKLQLAEIRTGILREECQQETRKT